jgi:hypothetical protein
MVWSATVISRRPERPTICWVRLKLSTHAPRIIELKYTPGTASVRTISTPVSIFVSREKDTTTISSMIAIITAKLAKMRWRNVQFFTVSPRGRLKCCGV